MSANETLIYLSKRKVKKASSIITDNGNGQSEVVFSNTSVATPPSDSGLPHPDKNKFTFFVNGQFIEYDAIELQQNGSDLELLVFTGSVGYELEATDEVLGWGRFQ